jgi:hypothetical protein
MRKIKINEYEVVEDLKNGIFKALRHGEEWKDLIGDNFVLSLVDELERTKRELSESNSLLSDAHNLLDDIHGYDNDVYRAISKYFYGEDED